MRIKRETTPGCTSREKEGIEDKLHPRGEGVNQGQFAREGEGTAGVTSSSCGGVEREEDTLMSVKVWRERLLEHGGCVKEAGV
jgi:hypothetical protein